MTWAQFSQLSKRPPTGQAGGFACCPPSPATEPAWEEGTAWAPRPGHTDHPLHKHRSTYYKLELGAAVGPSAKHLNTEITNKPGMMLSFAMKKRRLSM